MQHQVSKFIPWKTISDNRRVPLVGPVELLNPSWRRRASFAMKSPNLFRSAAKNQSGNTAENCYQNQYPEWNGSFVEVTSEEPRQESNRCRFFCVIEHELNRQTTGTIVKSWKHWRRKRVGQQWDCGCGIVEPVRETRVHKMAAQRGTHRERGVCRCIVEKTPLREFCEGSQLQNDSCWASNRELSQLLSQNSAGWKLLSGNKPKTRTKF